MYQDQDQGLAFRKSSYSATRNECVEVADTFGASAVRDSTRPDSGHLMFDTSTWAAFVRSVRDERL